MLILESRPAEFAARPKTREGAWSQPGFDVNFCPALQQSARQIVKCASPPTRSSRNPDCHIAGKQKHNSWGRGFISPDRQVGDVESAAERCSMLLRSVVLPTFPFYFPRSCGLKRGINGRAVFGVVAEWSVAKIAN